MRRFRIRAAAFAAVSAVYSLALGTAPARADNGPDHDDARFLFFSGGDVWRNGGFVHGGLLWSPDGLSKEGFTFKFIAASGTYRYRSGALGGAQVTGNEMSAMAMPGWRFKWNGVDLTVFGGLAVQNDRLTPDDVSAGLRGTEVGASGGFDLWYQPSPDTMATVSGFFSSIGLSYSARAAYGWRVLDRFYLGPEIQGLGSDNYRQIRAGVHVTGFQTGNYEWSAAAGWSDDSDHSEGIYGRIGILTRH